MVVDNERNQRPRPRKVQAKFLADENVPLESVLALKEQGIDIKSVIEHKKGLSDEEVLKLAKEQTRILITFDQDFGELAFRRRFPAKGIVLLRFEPPSSQEVTRTISNLFSRGIKVENCFTVVEKDRIRILPYPHRTR